MFRKGVNTDLTPVNTLFVDAMYLGQFRGILASVMEFYSKPLLNRKDEVALILKGTMEEAGKSFLKTVPAEAQVVIVGSWLEK